MVAEGVCCSILRQRRHGFVVDKIVYVGICIAGYEDCSRGQSGAVLARPDVFGLNT